MTQKKRKEEKKRLVGMLKVADALSFNALTIGIDYYYEQLADHLLYNCVIVPPCKAGDTVYLIMAAYSTLDKSTYFAEPIEGVVDGVWKGMGDKNEIDIRLNSDFGGEIVYRTFEDYKKTFFLDRKEAVAALEIILKDITREEAEQALKERNDENSV